MINKRNYEFVFDIYLLDSEQPGLSLTIRIYFGEKRSKQLPLKDSCK